MNKHLIATAVMAVGVMTSGAASAAVTINAWDVADITFNNVTIHLNDGWTVPLDAEVSLTEELPGIYAVGFHFDGLSGGPYHGGGLLSYTLTTSPGYLVDGVHLDSDVVNGPTTTTLVTKDVLPANLTLLSPNGQPDGWYSFSGAPSITVTDDFSAGLGVYKHATNSFNVTAVPEPETYAMMMAGLGVLGFLGRRRKAQ